MVTLLPISLFSVNYLLYFNFNSHFHFMGNETRNFFGTSIQQIFWCQDVADVSASSSRVFKIITLCDLWIFFATNNFVAVFVRIALEKRFSSPEKKMY